MGRARIEFVSSRVGCNHSLQAIEQLAVDLEGHAHRAYRVFRSVHLVCQSAAVLVEDGGVYRRDDGVVEMILRINHLCGSSGNSARPCASP